MAILFPIWIIAHCISCLANLGFTRLVSGNTVYIISLIVNILGLMLGLTLFFNPWASALTFAYIVGLYLILLGVENILLAISKLGEKR